MHFVPLVMRESLLLMEPRHRQLFCATSILSGGTRPLIKVKLELKAYNIQVTYFKTNNAFLSSINTKQQQNNKPPFNHTHREKKK